MKERQQPGEAWRKPLSALISAVSHSRHLLKVPNCHVKTQRTEPSVKEFRGHLDKLNNTLPGWALGGWEGLQKRLQTLGQRLSEALYQAISGLRRMPLFLLREIS